jgi:hypothetical protein
MRLRGYMAFAELETIWSGMAIDQESKSTGKKAK